MGTSFAQKSESTSHDDNKAAKSDRVGASTLLSNGLPKTTRDLAGVAAPTQNNQPSGSDDGRVMFDLLIAIDQSARAGLHHVEQKPPDVAAANVNAAQLASRIEHFLSITEKPDVEARLGHFQHDAERAFGRSEHFAHELESHGGRAEQIKTALNNVTIKVVGNWKWRPVGSSRLPVGGGLRWQDSLRIATASLAKAAQRARADAKAKDPATVIATATVVGHELHYAHRELALAANAREVQPSWSDDVLQVGEALAVLEGAAFRLGVGENGAVNVMRDAETQLRALVGLPTPRPFWDSAVPTLNAIIEIMNRSVVVDRTKGVAHPKWHPSHHREVPARYRPLLDEWLLITHGTVGQADGSKVQLRGAMLTQRLDAAVAKTTALINLIQNEAKPDSLDILDDFFPKVAEFRNRATSQTVGDAIEDKARGPLKDGQSPLEELSPDHQLELAATRLMTVARTMSSTAQRLASTNSEMAKLALKAFLDEFPHTSGIPAPLIQKLSSATSIAQVAVQIQGLVNGVQAVLNIADPDQRHRVWEAEFGKLGMAGGAAEVGKNLLWLVQGGIATYGTAGYALLRAKGLPVKASDLAFGTSKALSNINVGVNVLNVVHGALMIAYGDGVEKVDGAVEAVWGALGLIGRFVPRVARFTGPLSAAILIGWTTVKWIGEQAMGALYGIVRLGVNWVFADMKHHALEIYGEAMRLAVALEMGGDFTDPALLAELKKQIEQLTRILAGSLRSYIARTQVKGRNQDPGSWAPFRTRFAPMTDLKLDTPFEVLIGAEQMMELVIACHADYKNIVDEAFEDTLKEHGERQERH